ncbi:hypothetical protein GCM10011344_30990 [Dokdonia pacifica]|uniref:Methyltransferase FkbM domain-containing protein n=1 Tax=Dokdonia pacifica TaxID=1627892 RepID=A0A239BRM0_9FLAO|nr:FkbM family methyltransferase [Dokdonia pacifica]GGG27992.1 hypothetical protein GCM10011344_30990 [Dokdonia pacifica]SNS10319.1 Methyltransferase FkbM domain-containing protein [Dokdonia pacifica]
MLNSIKRYIKMILRSNGLYVEKSTSKNAVLSLIKSLYPIAIDKDLIRLGPEYDGGYLVPDDLENIKACFSPGVGRMSNFEFSCLEYGMQLFLADKSVDGPGIENKQLNFLKKYVGPINNDDYTTLDDWVASSMGNDPGDLMLQMDIEGFEYFTILNASEQLLKRFRVIVIEFHNLHKLWNKEFYLTASLVFQKILQNHYCIHIHPNNISPLYVQNGVEIPSVAEFTFIRKDRSENKGFRTDFPHQLDRDNTPNSPVVLPKIWYKA